MNVNHREYGEYGDSTAEDAEKNIESFRNSVTFVVNRFFLGFNGFATGRVLCIILLLSGCATVPTEADLAGTLKERAEVYWKLRMADKYEETYKMEYKEGLSPFIEYIDKVRAMKKFSITSHSVGDSKIEGQKATVQVEVSFIMPMITRPFKQVLLDGWVYERGKWWHQLPRN